MCSTSKRSFGEGSDDDFDDSLHKRLKIRRRETKLKTKSTSKAKQSRQRLQVRIQKVNSNVSTKSASSYNTSVSVTDTVTNSTIPSVAGNGSIVNEESRNEDECLGIVNDQNLDFNCSNLSDSRLSADQIISDILGDSFGDERDDAGVTVSVDQSTTATTSSIQSRLPEVPSPRKQSSLFQYFKLKKGKSISENPHQSSSDGSAHKNCLPVSIHCSSNKTALTNQLSTTSHSNFNNKSKRDCPFYKKLPGT